MNKITLKQKRLIRELAYQIDELDGDSFDYFKAADNNELTTLEASDWISAAMGALEELKEATPRR